MNEQHGKFEFRHDNSPGKTVAKYVDEAMFTATPIDVPAGPKVYLLNMTPDPLGAIAAACKGYEGQFVHDLSEITDDERRKYFEQVQKTHLQAPFEFVHLHFLIEGVTRGFTHQLVRQRTATYVQESTRFAVKDDMPVGLPPSLAGTATREEWLESELLNTGWPRWAGREQEERHIERNASDAQKRRIVWEEAREQIQLSYEELIKGGMPAEDARGLLPTNLLTRVQYRTDLKSLIEHGGNRLCTQAQFEWRTVFSKIVEAIRDFPTQGGRGSTFLKDSWQYDKISKVFRPICYLTGKCEFKADFDRKCSIRARVDANAAIGRPSSEWDREHDVVVGNPIVSGVGSESVVRDEDRRPVFIGAIQPAEWLLDPGAAR